MKLDEIEWKISNAPVPYEDALAFMELRVADIIAGNAGPCVWFLEHPPLYTAGTSAKPDDLLNKDKFPVYAAGRGGEYTYHGPGQLVVYVMMDLKQLFAPEAPDLKAYIARLEHWIIAALQGFGVAGSIREGMIGVWVDENMECGVLSDEPAMQSTMQQSAGFFGGNQTQVKKVAAIGVRVRKWVAYHGVCINVQTNLDDYQGIVPCGISEYGVTSFDELGVTADIPAVRKVMQEKLSSLLQGH